MYFFRLGFLDGRAGWHLARLMASYEYMITLLYKEKMAGVETRMTKPQPSSKSSNVEARILESNPNDE